MFCSPNLKYLRQPYQPSDSSDMSDIQVFSQVLLRMLRQGAKESGHQSAHGNLGGWPI